MVAAKNCCYRVKAWVKEGENLLLVLTVCGVICGAALGFLLRLADISDTGIMLISFPGEILMSILKCLILPMIIASLISSLVQLDTKTSGRMGVLTLLFYIVTTTLAVTLSVVLVMVIGPGYRTDKGIVAKSTGAEKDRSLDTILDLIRHVFPENIFQATMQQVETQESNVSNVQPNGNITYKMSKEMVYSDNPNVLGIVAFSIAFGFIAAWLDAKPMIKWFIALDAIIMKLVSIIMWYAPVGIMFLIAGNILEVDNLSSLMQALGWFMLTSLLGLMTHFFVVLPIIYLVITRKNPYKFLWNQAKAWINVLGHSSSSAALPITKHCLEEKNKVDYRVSRFVLPVGATINIDGAALYEAMASVFVAQLHHMPLSIGKVIAIVLTVTLSSVGSSCLPGAGLISVLPVLAPIPVTNSDVALLISMDWFVDRIRTCNNVMGDSLAAGCVNHLCISHLKRVDTEIQMANGHATGVDNPEFKQDEVVL